VRTILVPLVLLAALALGVGSAGGRTLVTTTVTVTSITGSGTVTSNPSGISCPSTCSYSPDVSSPIILFATPASGWVFDSWGCSAGSGENVVGTTCQIDPDGGSHNITATFTAIPPPSPPPGTGTIAVSVIGKGRVTSDPDGITCGDGKKSCSRTFSGGGEELTANETDDDWHFDAWSDWDVTTDSAGPCDGNGGTCAVTGNDNRQITANFVGPSASTRTLSVSFAGPGTVTGGNQEVECGSAASDCSWSAPDGSVLAVFETPDSSSVFSGWSGDCGGGGIACTVELDGNRSVNATWTTASAATLTANVTGSGTITGGGLDCPSTCSATKEINSSVTLTATPSSGYVFSSWTGACASSTATTCTFTMTADTAVTATFAPAAQLSVAVSGNGSVSGGSGAINCGNGATICGATFAQNATVTLVATATTGATFAGWSGACGGTTTTCTVLMSAAKSVTASFTGGAAGTGFALSVTVTGNGTVSGGGITCGTGGSVCTSANHAPNSTVTLTATPTGGATFTGWGGACTGTTPSCTVVMTSAKAVTATFQGGVATYQLTVSVTGNGTVTGGGINCGRSASACAASVAGGTTVVLSATPAAGATFTGWGGACSGTGRTCTVTMNAAKGVSARFSGGASAPGALTIAVSGRGTVSTAIGSCSSTGPQRTCVEQFGVGAKARLTATPASGASFLGWGGACSGAARTCSLTMSTSRSVTARFSGAPGGPPTARGALRSLGRPIVRRHATGFRVTLRFSTSVGGLVHVRGLRAGRIGASVVLRVAAGRATIGPFPVAKPGLYTFEARLAGRVLRWRACLGRCGAASKAGPFVLARRAPTVSRAGDVWSVTLHYRANLISDARIRVLKGGKSLVNQHFLGRAGRRSLGPFLLGPGSYTLRLTATDPYGRVRTLGWIVALAP
jgi:uncharacterized repeat protein (TIGR02543 family)